MKEADRIFLPNEYYHIYNRGVDKRNIFSDHEDLLRFFESMSEFNSLSAIGSIYENNFRKRKGLKRSSDHKNRLVNFVCFCLNPNHYHFIITPVVEKGIERFMQRLGTGYTMYFNNKYKRTGSLFSGKFKSIHVGDNNYLLHLSAYVNLNSLVHNIKHNDKKFIKSSWSEYSKILNNNFCDKEVILEQFKNRDDYVKFAKDSLEYTKMRRYDKCENLKDDKILLEDD